MLAARSRGGCDDRAQKDSHTTRHRRSRGVHQAGERGRVQANVRVGPLRHAGCLPTGAQHGINLDSHPSSGARASLTHSLSLSLSRVLLCAGYSVHGDGPLYARGRVLSNSVARRSVGAARDCGARLLCQDLGAAARRVRRARAAHVPGRELLLRGPVLLSDAHARLRLPPAGQERAVRGAHQRRRCHVGSRSHGARARQAPGPLPVAAVVVPRGPLRGGARHA